MKKIILCLLFILQFFLLSAQVPMLVKNINPGNASSNTYLSGATLGNNFIFAATDGNGEELWITDASNGGTYQLKDINPGAASSYPRNFVIFQNQLYFVADNGTNGKELWKTDGTAAGTQLVYDIYPGSSSGFVYTNPVLSLIFEIVWNNNGYFYFIANSAASGGNDDVELWKSDGTNGGTSRVADINSGINGSFPRDFDEFNNLLFFVADDGIHGSELWKTDGTTSGTQLVKDIYLLGSAFFIPNSLQPLSFDIVWSKNGYFYFIANSLNSSSDDDVELWKSDGTTAGTTIVKDIYPGLNGSFPQYFAEFNGTLFFAATDVNGSELWKTDGSTAGTVMVKNINPSGSGFSIPNSLQALPFEIVWTNNGYFYFIANSLNTSGMDDVELWKSDGSTGGTTIVADIYPGNQGSYPEDFYIFNNTLYFLASDAANGLELWKTDGSGSGTQMVKNINPTGSAFVITNGFNIIHLTILWENNGSFYFKASSFNNGTDDDVELWKSDGTNGGTIRIADIRPGTSGSFPSNFIVFNNQLFFSANDGTLGRELWSTNGSGAQMVKDINPGALSGINTTYLYKIISYNSSFYFQAFSLSSIDNEIWKSDGTNGGTLKVLDIYPGPDGCSPNSFTLLPNDNLIFQATDPVNGKELWTMYFPGITSFNEIQNQNDVTVYPNPTNGENVNVKFSETGNYSINVFDVAGKKLQAYEYTTYSSNDTYTLNLKNLQQGLYLIQINDNHNLNCVKKIQVLK
jgi:trimeric autotransporter adhesin